MATDGRRQNCVDQFLVENQNLWYSKSMRTLGSTHAALLEGAEADNLHIGAALFRR